MVKGMVAVLAVGLGLLAGGCKGYNLIDHVDVQPSQDLSRIKISLVFTHNVRSELSGSFLFGQYGFLFVNPYAPSQPFELGFSLETAVFNEQEYLKLKATEVLPNGLPTGIGYPVAELKAQEPVSSRFDLYGYVDVVYGQWLGGAAIFSFMDDRYFPNGLSLTQVFLRDDRGNPGVIASVFGPTVDNEGKIVRTGGIAVFANVRQLMDEQAKGRFSRRMTYYSEPMPMVAGPRAREYDKNVGKLRVLEANVIRGFNAQPPLK